MGVEGDDAEAVEGGPAVRDGEAGGVEFRKDSPSPLHNVKKVI